MAETLQEQLRVRASHRAEWTTEAMLYNDAADRIDQLERELAEAKDTIQKERRLFNEKDAERIRRWSVSVAEQRERAEAAEKSLAETVERCLNACLSVETEALRHEQKLIAWGATKCIDAIRVSFLPESKPTEVVGLQRFDGPGWAGNALASDSDLEKP